MWSFIAGFWVGTFFTLFALYVLIGNIFSHSDDGLTRKSCEKCGEEYIVGLKRKHVCSVEEEL